MTREDMMKVKEAYENGAQVQYLDVHGWHDVASPAWWDHTDYRIKPDDLYTADTIPWDALSDQLQWSYRQPDGSIIVSTVEPELFNSAWGTRGGYSLRIDYYLKMKAGSGPWQASKQKRPAERHTVEDTRRAAQLVSLRAEVERLTRNYEEVMKRAEEATRSFAELSRKIAESVGGSFVDRVYASGGLVSGENPPNVMRRDDCVFSANRPSYAPYIFENGSIKIAPPMTEKP